MSKAGKDAACSPRCAKKPLIQSLTRPGVRRYLTLMKTTVSSKGQIVLPAELRQQDDIEAGQEFEVERLDRGEYRLVRTSAPPNHGVVDWLLACPEKGYFVPIESESTDTL
jgi:AbrB family looped-hinge helix DNA binding protein